MTMQVKKSTAGHKAAQPMSGQAAHLSDLGKQVKGVLPGASAIGRYLRGGGAMVPVAIGAFLLGAAAAIAGAMFLPKIRSGEVLSQLGANARSAAEKLGEVLHQAQHKTNGATPSMADGVAPSHGPVT